MLLMYVKAFVIGGLICTAGQLLLLYTRLTSARILVLFFGVYEPFASFAGAGATVPLTGFGYLLGKGAIDGAREKGFLGALSGGTAAAAGGIAAAIALGYLAAVLFTPKTKE